MGWLSKLLVFLGLAKDEPLEKERAKAEQKPAAKQSEANGSVGSSKRQAFNRSEEVNQTDLERLKEKAVTWRNRAAMARRQGMYDLAKQALEHMWIAQVAVAKLLGHASPDSPPTPEEFYGGWPGDEEPPPLWPDDEPPWRPFNPSGGPTKPSAKPGGRAIAPPRPGKDRNKM